MKTGGGKKLFGVREQPLPRVRDLRVVEDLRLAPQRWLPTGVLVPRCQPCCL